MKTNPSRNEVLEEAALHIENGSVYSGYTEAAAIYAKWIRDLKKVAPAAKEDGIPEEFCDWFEYLRPSVFEIMQMPAGVSMGEVEEWTLAAWKAGSKSVSAEDRVKGK